MKKFLITLFIVVMVCVLYLPIQAENHKINFQNSAGKIYEDSEYSADVGKYEKLYFTINLEPEKKDSGLRLYIIRNSVDEKVEIMLLHKSIQGCDCIIAPQIDVFEKELDLAEGDAINVDELGKCKDVYTEVFKYSLFNCYMNAVGYNKCTIRASYSNKCYLLFSKTHKVNIVLNDAQKELFQVFFIGKENKAKKETTIYKRKSPGQILRNSILSK